MKFKVGDVLTYKNKKYFMCIFKVTGFNNESYELMNISDPSHNYNIGFHSIGAVENVLYKINNYEDEEML